MASRLFDIRVRTVMLGLKHKDIIDRINRQGKVTVSASEYSRALGETHPTEKTYAILNAANEVLDAAEKQKGIIKND